MPRPKKKKPAALPAKKTHENVVELWYHEDGRALVYDTNGKVYTLEPESTGPTELTWQACSKYLRTSGPSVRCHKLKEPYPFLQAHAFVREVRVAENVLKRIDRAFAHKSVTEALGIIKGGVETLLAIPHVFDYITHKLASRPADLRPDLPSIMRLDPCGRFLGLLEAAEWHAWRADAPSTDGATEMKVA